MKLAIFGVVAFVVGIAGGTGVGVMRAPRSQAGADSTKVAHATAPAKASSPAVDAVAASSGAGVTPVHPDADTSAATTPSSNPSNATAGTGAHATSPEAGVNAHAASAVTPVAGTDARTNAGSSTASTGSPTPAAGNAPAETQREDFRQVARILTNMKPTDAAKIMSYLGDDLVEGIIRAIGPRQAAVLLTQIPPQRAAALSRKLIQHPSPEVR